MAMENLPKILDELLEVLRNKLIIELSDAECVICENKIYSSSYDKWEWYHIPYYSIQSGVAKVGYRCPSKPNEPIIVYEISLQGLLGGVERRKTRLLE